MQPQHVHRLQLARLKKLTFHHQPTNHSGEKTHVVLPGERLIDVKNQHGVNESTLMQHNKSILFKPGQELAISLSDYFTTKNDSWAKIASSSGISEVDLRRFNPNFGKIKLISNHVIKIGCYQRIKPGESVQTICQRYHTYYAKQQLAVSRRALPHDPMLLILYALIINEKLELLPGQKLVLRK